MDQVKELKLNQDTKLGYVHLTVADLSRSLDFYQRSMGFEIHRKQNGTAFLGAGGDDLLVLTETPDAVKVPRRSGLYHFAILTPSRKALAKSLRNLINTETALQGGSDHLVSEAIYLSDPDGNGIEIYRDRARADWQYENGILKMGTKPLDYQGILNEISETQNDWSGLESETMLGHVHLHVSHLAEATNFYEKTIGFDFLMSYLGSASFLSAGGYHHHIGLNTWKGVGVPPAPENSIGMRYFTIKLSDEAERERLVKRLNRDNVLFEISTKGLLVRDPSKNGILFTIN